LLAKLVTSGIDATVDMFYQELSLARKTFRFKAREAKRRFKPLRPELLN
jgi:hypothetical protein